MDEQYQEENNFNDIEANNRIRILESKYNLTRERLLMINQNMIDQYKNLISEVKSQDEEVKELKSELFKIKGLIRSILKETNIFAKKEDLKLLEKYINLWDPLKFVTEEDVIKIIKKTKNAAKSKK